MTLNERVTVVKLAKLLFPAEIERYPQDVCSSDCVVCPEQVAEWDALLWRVYNALIEVGIL